MKTEKFERMVPDTNIIIEGILSKKLESKEYIIDEILIHEAVLAELEHQANLGKSIGFLGLEEIKKLKKYNIKFAGTRPKAVDIKYATEGEIDAIIRQLAYETDSTLITSDKVQHKVAEAKGIAVIYIKPEISSKKIKLEQFFDETTMSVHLKEGVEAYAKKGFPGNWKFKIISKKKLTQEEIQEISTEIIEESKIRRDGFIEIERTGSTIIQLGKFRIVITRPPFSDGWEITAVRPVKKLNLEEYNLSEKLKKRIAEQAEGMLVAGSPGAGKSTFAQALAEHYASKDKIVKTVEAPRDLQLADNITQYAISHGTPQEIHDILLLSRPDYTLFDEMRNTKDFELFADLRLAGIGFIGVIHATNPIDAIQRFLGRTELGVIPHIIDTVVFIKNGLVDKVLSVIMTVKVPTGMTEADLSRPVVEVRDFETNKLEFELYSYGEETVVIPVSEESTNKKPTFASKALEEEFKRYSRKAKAELISNHKAIVYVPKDEIAKIIGKEGKHIAGIEKELGIKIDIRELEDEVRNEKAPIRYNLTNSKGYVILSFAPELAGRNIDVYKNDELLFSATLSKRAEIRIHKKSGLGQEISSGKLEVKI